MRKSELIACVGNVLGNPGQAARVVDATFAIIIEAVECGENVVLPNFGEFRMVELPGAKNAKTSTGENSAAGPRRIMEFNPDPELEKAMTDYTL